jgi:hypothetical protein
MHFSHMLHEDARPEVMRDNMGHTNIDVTQNVYGKSWWEVRVDAVTQAVEAVTDAGQNARVIVQRPCPSCGSPVENIPSKAPKPKRRKAFVAKESEPCEPLKKWANEFWERRK